MNSMKPRRLTVLDGWRGIAALSVVFLHAHIGGSVTELTFFHNADLFVEFFFVLSGFVLMHAFGDHMSPGAVGPFMRRRFWRLYPLHIAGFVAIVVLGLVRWMISRHGVAVITRPFTGPNAPAEIIPNLLLIHGWLHGPFHGASFNYPSWSISIEFYVYLIFAVALCVPRRWVGLALASLCSFGVVLEATGSSLLTMEACRGLAGFFAGAMLYRLAGSEASLALAQRVSRRLFTIAELAAVAAMVAFMSVASLPYRFLVADALFCAVVLVFASQRGGVSRLMNSGPVQRAGELSYSIYLTHAAVLFCAQFGAYVVQSHTHLQLYATVRDPATGASTRQFMASSPLVGNAMLAVILVATIAVSMMTRRWIELPGIEIGRRLAQRRAARTIDEPLVPDAVPVADPA